MNGYGVVYLYISMVHILINHNHIVDLFLYLEILIFVYL